MATANVFLKFCELCKLSNEPVLWCSECDKFLCMECSEQHTLSKLSGQHSIVPITEYQTIPPFILDIKQSCDKHHERFQTFCKSHDCPCCRKCVKESHQKCKDIVLLEEVIHHAKTSPQIQEIMTQLTDLANNFTKIQVNRENNLNSLRKQKKIIEKEISETRKKISDHLDNLQKTLLKELTKEEEKANSQIQEIITTLQKKENNINEIKTGLDNINRYASDLQAFLGMKQIESVALENETYLQSLVKGGHFNHTNLSLKINDIIRELDDNLKSFGKIRVEKKPIEVAIDITKHKQAQMLVPNILPKSIDNVVLKLDRKIQHKAGGIWGCCLFQNSSIIFSSENDQCLFLLNTDGSKDFIVDLGPGRPLALTCIDNHEIAVAVDYSVRIINIDNKSVQRTIRGVGGIVCGFTYKDGTLLCCVYKKGILRINLDNDTVTTVVSCPLSSRSYVTTNDNNIYFTDRNAHTVICCDMNGTTKWQCKHDYILKYSRGVTVDRNGYIYVVGSGNLNIVVISPNGKQLKEVVYKQEGLNDPTCIHCDKTTNQILVANSIGRAFVYNVEVE